MFLMENYLSTMLLRLFYFRLGKRLSLPSFNSYSRLKVLYTTDQSPAISSPVFMLFNHRWWPRGDSLGLG